MPRRAYVSAALRAAIAAVLASAGAGAPGAAASDRWTAVLTVGGEALAPLHPALAENYALAMADYRTLRGEAAGASHMAGRLAAPEARKWHWRSAAGGSVKRIGDGLFRLTEDNCLSALCSEVDCFAGTWPDFECTDGRPRKMSAPDLATVVFDGVTYTRSLPPVDDSVLDEVPPDADYTSEIGDSR